MKERSSMNAFSVAFALLFSTAANAAQQETIRGNTYCEILWGPPPTNGTTTLTVSWNGTYGMCPANPGFYNVTEQDVRAVHGQQNATVIVWNGMRQWTLDALLPQENTTSDEEVFYEYGSDIFEDGSGLVMRQQATVPVNIQSNPYLPNPVTRKVTAVWKADTTVYELVAPNCSAVYTMQSLFLGRPGNLGLSGGESDLATLETSGTISPPQGWQYRVRTLEADLVIEGEDGVTKVVQDDVANTYSCHDMPLDPSVCELMGGTTSTASSISRFAGLVMSSFVLVWLQ